MGTHRTAGHARPDDDPPSIATTVYRRPTTAPRERRAQAAGRTGSDRECTRPVGPVGASGARGATDDLYAPDSASDATSVQRFLDLIRTSRGPRRRDPAPAAARPDRARRHRFRPRPRSAGDPGGGVGAVGRGLSRRTQHGPRPGGGFGPLGLGSIDRLLLRCGRYLIAHTVDFGPIRL